MSLMMNLRSQMLRLSHGWICFALCHGAGGKTSKSVLMARARDVLAPCGVHSPEFQPKNSVANCRKCCNHPFLFNGAEAAMRDVMHAECDDTIVRCAGVWCGG